MKKPLELDNRSIVTIARDNFSRDDFDRLTFEKSVPLFPQATYRVPTYELRQFVEAVRAAVFGAYPGWGWNNGNYGPLGLVVFLILVIVLLRVAHIV